jgi:hypothetical protein
VELVALL